MVYQHTLSFRLSYHLVSPLREQLSHGHFYTNCNVSVNFHIFNASVTSM